MIAQLSGTKFESHCKYMYVCSTRMSALLCVGATMMAALIAAVTVAKFLLQLLLSWHLFNCRRMSQKCSHAMHQKYIKAIEIAIGKSQIGQKQSATRQLSQTATYCSISRTQSFLILIYATHANIWTMVLLVVCLAVLLNI